MRLIYSQSRWPRWYLSSSSYHPNLQPLQSSDNCLLNTVLSKAGLSKHIFTSFVDRLHTTIPAALSFDIHNHHHEQFSPRPWAWHEHASSSAFYFTYGTSLSHPVVLLYCPCHVHSPWCSVARLWWLDNGSDDAFFGLRRCTGLVFYIVSILSLISVPDILAADHLFRMIMLPCYCNYYIGMYQDTERENCKNILDKYQAESDHQRRTQMKSPTPYVRKSRHWTKIWQEQGTRPSTGSWKAEDFNGYPVSPQIMSPHRLLEYTIPSTTT